MENLDHMNNIMKKRTEDKNITPGQKYEKIKMQMPHSEENLLIIPCNPSGFGFLLLDEELTYLNDISTNKLNKTLRKFNKIIDLALIKKKIEESKDYNANNIFILNLLFALGLTVAFIMYMLALFDVDNFKENLIWIPLAILLCIVVLAMVVMMKGLLQKREFVNINTLIKKNLKEALDSEYKSMYQQRGYKLELGTEFCWIGIRRVF